MESLIHNDYRQQPIASDEARDHYRAHLGQLEVLVSDQEDAVLRARVAGASADLSQARTTLWRLLTKRQHVLDALATYENEKRPRHSA